MALHDVIGPEAIVAAGIVLIIVFVLYLLFSSFSMVGITPLEVVVLLFVSPLIAWINIPVYSAPGVTFWVNAAGLGVPLVLSVRFLLSRRLRVWKGVAGTGVVAVVAYQVARVVPGEGILVPALPLVLVTAVVGVVFAWGRWEELGPATYVSGSMGTLVGADLLNLGAFIDPGREGSVDAVVGGAGTLDAIFLISLWAVVATILMVLVARVLGGGRG